MHFISLDPLDAGHPQRKAWEEFRASFSSCFLQIWMLDELDELAPDYFAELQSRLFKGLLNADQLAQLDDEYDGAVPLQSPNEQSVWFIDRKDAEELYEQLFPHGEREAGDKSAAFGLAVVGLHSALEAYSRAVGVTFDRPLPLAILAYLRSGAPSYDLDARTADLLTEFHQTRRIMVHNRGIVDFRYINAVKDNRLLDGEEKRLNFAITSEYANAVWKTAGILRHAWWTRAT